jgi:hypothetical protein
MLVNGTASDQCNGRSSAALFETGRFLAGIHVAASPYRSAGADQPKVGAGPPDGAAQRTALAMTFSTSGWW